MKKLIALVLALVCVLALVGCNNTKGDEVMEDFVGVVTAINVDNTGCIVKVTDSGSSTLKVGDSVFVQIADGRNVECSVDDYIKVEFDGVVEEVTQLSSINKHIPRAFTIEKVDTTE